MQPNLLVRIINKLRGRDPLAEYYARLAKFGRITEGHVVDINQDAGNTMIYYHYKIANVDYETSQKLSAEQLLRSDVYQPGSRVTVRFDPKHPGRSVVP